MSESMKGRKRAQSSKRGKSPVLSTGRVYSFWMFCAQWILPESRVWSRRKLQPCQWAASHILGAANPNPCVFWEPVREAKLRGAVPALLERARQTFYVLSGCFPLLLGVFPLPGAWTASCSHINGGPGTEASPRSGQWWSGSLARAG